MAEVANNVPIDGNRPTSAEDQAIELVNQANDSDASEASDIPLERFFTRAAFLLTPSHELSLDRAAAICDRMPFKGKFSVAKTATGILFKFSNSEDCAAVLRKGFHRVTGARLYRKVSIPCRPQRVYAAAILDTPSDLPLEDICHCLDRMRFVSVLEVRRPAGPSVGMHIVNPGSGVSSTGPPIRVTLASQDEYQMLIQRGLDFYGATCFAVEPAPEIKQEKKKTSISLNKAASARLAKTLSNH
ncbi:uncharacterized protein LOC123302704 isoform X2 [Chrysoperla carnea]|uniref:uncharacterized protein LOC123302704 isoform X2 n=1 Tax=Chrysoperla carnea TaxID=189513 RepID=UPI001D08C643|nr:uncharacterized protein LOC123302704 isoform X2 [Chrysoperla carnea]